MKLSGLIHIIVFNRLEFSCLGCAQEGDDVADVGHAGNKEHQVLEAKSEAGVGAATIATRDKVQPHA